MTVQVKLRSFGKLSAAVKAAVRVWKDNEPTATARRPQQVQVERIVGRPSAPIFRPQKLSAAEQQRAIDALSKSGKRFAEVDS